MNCTRREFARGLTLAGTAGALGMHPTVGAAEPPPETTIIKLLYRRGNICQGILFLAKEALHKEGFREVQYVVKPTVAEYFRAVERGDADLSTQFSAPAIVRLEEGVPIVFLAGLHVGCVELFGTDKVRAIRDLKGKTVCGSRAAVEPAHFDRQHARPCRHRPAQRGQVGQPYAGRIGGAPERRKSRCARRYSS